MTQTDSAVALRTRFGSANIRALNERLRICREAQRRVEGLPQAVPSNAGLEIMNNESRFTSAFPWLTAERASKAAQVIAWMALCLQLVALVATVVRLEPHALGYFESHIPGWLKEMREAREQRLQKQHQQQAQQKRQ